MKKVFSFVFIILLLFSCVDAGNPKTIHYPETDDYIVYIAESGNGTKYHRYTCSTLNNSIKVSLMKSQAIVKGYGPCKRCKP